MSVIVKGMEMPNTCEECQESCEIGSNLFCLVVNDENKWGWKKSENGFESRPVWCPLRPLPKNHGRLVDESEVRHTFGMAKKCEECKQDKYDCQYDQIFTRMDFCGWLDDMETIVEAEGDDS